VQYVGGPSEPWKIRVFPHGNHLSVKGEHLTFGGAQAAMRHVEEHAKRWSIRLLDEWRFIELPPRNIRSVQ
jgi:hypothetical protein